MITIDHWQPLTKAWRGSGQRSTSWVWAPILPWPLARQTAPTATWTGFRLAWCACLNGRRGLPPRNQPINEWSNDGHLTRKNGFGRGSILLTWQSSVWQQGYGKATRACFCNNPGFQDSGLGVDGLHHEWELGAQPKAVPFLRIDRNRGLTNNVPLNSWALKVLSRREGRHPKWVFALKDNPVYSPNTRAWREALKRAGIEDFRWHDLRHTWASWHVQSGTSLQELKELGGWSSFEMVLRYAHLGGDHLKGAANRILDTNRSQKTERGKLKLVVSN